VEAAVAAAREAYPDVLSSPMGHQPGRAAVLLHAGTFGGVAGSVRRERTRLPRHRHQGTARIQRWVSGRTGRIVGLARLLRTRVSREWDRVPDADEALAAIAPASPSWVHDRTTGTSPPDHARLLHEWARSPKACGGTRAVAMAPTCSLPAWPPGCWARSAPACASSAVPVAGGTPPGDLLCGCGCCATSPPGRLAIRERPGGTRRPRSRRLPAHHRLR